MTLGTIIDFYEKDRNYFLGIINNAALLSSSFGKAQNYVEEMVSVIESAMKNSKISFEMIDTVFSDCGRVYRLETKEDYIIAKMVLSNVDNVSNEYSVQFGYSRYIK